MRSIIPYLRTKTYDSPQDEIIELYDRLFHAECARNKALRKCKEEERDLRYRKKVMELRTEVKQLKTKLEKSEKQRKELLRSNDRLIFAAEAYKEEIKNLTSS